MTQKIYILLFLISFSAFGQSKLDSLLRKENKRSVPYISVEKLALKKDIVLLDSREQKEFDTSHIANATCVGYDKFDLKKTMQQFPDKNKTIIVYCSLGIRSEDVGEKLKKAGYKNVYNLYGGIFEWKNKGRSVVNPKGEKTEKVHTFNKDWSIWLKKGIKIYEKQKN